MFFLDKLVTWAIPRQILSDLSQQKAFKTFYRGKSHTAVSNGRVSLLWNAKNKDPLPSRINSTDVRIKILMTGVQCSSREVI